VFSKPLGNYIALQGEAAMKKIARRITDPERKRKRTLRLSQETVRKLSFDELSQAASGCDTTSWTTERLTHTC
jgi:hypothetical protein